MDTLGCFGLYLRFLLDSWTLHQSTDLKKKKNMNFVDLATMEITTILSHCVFVKPFPDGDKTLAYAN